MTIERSNKQCFRSSRYCIDIREELVEGEVFYECRVAELPGVVVYGNTKAAVHLDMRCLLIMLRVSTGEYGKSLPDPNSASVKTRTTPRRSMRTAKD
jgi:hypothetical protein